MGELKLSPLVYLDIVRHIQRFNNDIIPETDRKIVYGLVAGFVEDGVPNITKFVPFTHTNSPLDFELNHDFFKFADKFNTDHHDPKYASDEILGFVRSYPSENIDYSNIDKKNLLYFQSGYNENAVLFALDPSSDQYTMQIKHFKASLLELDESAELEDVPWNFGDVEDLDDLFKIVLQVARNRDAKLPLIKEVNEK